MVVRCPNWLGDTVMAIPAIRALRAAVPAAELWCVGPWVQAILATEPGIRRHLPHGRGWAARIDQVRALRRARPDLVVLLTNSFETALLAWLTGARWRLGYAGEGRDLLLTHAIAPGRLASHQVTQYLALLAPLGIEPATSRPTIEAAVVDRLEARRLLEAAGLQPGARPVGLQLGAGLGPSKLWPAERLGALATTLEARGLPVVFLGGPEALGLLAAAARAMPTAPRSLVGRDRPALLPALLGELALLVTPDSGPAHVAAAVGVPVLTLFGPTDPRLTAPLGPAAHAIWHQPVCGPCFLASCPIDHRCLAAITVEEVVAAALTHGRRPS